MPVIFTGDNGTGELRPAPLVTIDKVFQRDTFGSILQPEYRITLTGTIVNVGSTDVDSPAITDSTSGDLDDILAEQRRIMNLFNVRSGRLEISQPGGGGPNTLDFYSKVESINFESSTWTVRCNYTITLSATKLEDLDTNNENIVGQNEQWSFQENINGTVVVNHTLQAVGIPVYGPTGVENNPLTDAKEWCRDRSIVITTSGTLSYYGGVSGLFSLGTALISMGNGSGNFWNYIVSESVGTQELSWQLTESFLYDPQGEVREQYNSSYNFEPEDHRKIAVTINGVVIGNANREDNLTLRNQRASGYFYNTVRPNLYTRAGDFVPAGYSVNPTFTTAQVTFNRDAGVLEYSYSFLAVSGFLFSGAIEESISVSDSGPTDVFASIQIPGRSGGPLIQNMETQTSPERSVQISIIYGPLASGLTTSSIRGMYLAKPNTNAIITALVPESGYYYVKQDSEDWNPIRRQYSRNVQWVIDPDGATIAGIPTTISNGE